MRAVSLFLLRLYTELKQRLGLGRIGVERQKLHDISTPTGSIIAPSEGLPKVKLGFEPFVLRSLFLAQTPSSSDEWTIEDTHGKDLSQLSV